MVFFLKQRYSKNLRYLNMVVGRVNNVTQFVYSDIMNKFDTCSYFKLCRYDGMNMDLDNNLEYFFYNFYYLNL